MKIQQKYVDSLQDRDISKTVAGHEQIAPVILNLIYAHLQSKKRFSNQRVTESSSAELQTTVSLSFDATWLKPQLKQQCCPSETRLCIVLDSLKIVLSQHIVVFRADISKL
jgi:hypothetical protein